MECSNGPAAPRSACQRVGEPGLSDSVLASRWAAAPGLGGQVQGPVGGEIGSRGLGLPSVISPPRLEAREF